MAGAQTTSKRIMKISTPLILSVVLLFTSGRAPAQSSLTAEEKSQGWKLLFNGKDLEGWRSFKKKSGPKQGWVAENGVLKHLDKGGGGDIITEAEYNDFEVLWDWKIPAGANSGLKYFITEERSAAIGHEYQLIDDKGHSDAQVGAGKRVTASFYDVLAPTGSHAKDPGEWNSSRVIVKGNHVEHWLNGTKVLTYELGSSEVKEAVSQSKFKTVAGFGTKIKGHILLQDHGGEIEFRNLKIRES